MNLDLKVGMTGAELIRDAGVWAKRRKKALRRYRSRPAWEPRSRWTAASRAAEAYFQASVALYLAERCSPDENYMHALSHEEIEKIKEQVLTEMEARIAEPAELDRRLVNARRRLGTGGQNAVVG